MRSIRRGQSLIASCLLGLALSSTVAAAPIAVEWSAPAACGSAEQIEASFVRTFAERSSSDAYVEGHIRPATRGYRLDLTVDVDGERSMRTLTANDCESLVEAARWLIGLALGADPERPASAPVQPLLSEAPAAGAEAAVLEPPPESESDVARAAQAHTVDDGEAPAIASDDRPSAVSLRVGLVTGGSAAGLSGLDWSAGARVSLQIDALMFELSGLYHVPRAAALEIPSADVTFETQELDVSGCWRFGAELHGGPCLYVAVLHTRGESHGISEQRDDAMWWLASGVSGSVGYAVSERFELRLDGGAWIPLTARPSFEVAVPGRTLPVGEVAAAGGFVRVGIDWVLP